MSKKILRRVREELESIRTTDIFAAGVIKDCITLCNSVLNKDYELPPHQVHSDTSRAAAIDIAPKFGGMTLSVLVFLAGRQGMTDEEAQNALSMAGDSYRPCRVTLANRGYVTDTGERRRTAHRKLAIVWAVTDKGRSYLAEQAA